MKKIFTLVLGVFCAMSQVMADKIEVSTTLPAEGKPEHVYTMVNGNGVYSNSLTAPTQTAANYGLFAFYAVDGVENAYYIYSHNGKKWLTYTPAASYNNGKDFVKLSDAKPENYFLVENYSGDNYQIRPFTTSGEHDKYVNWYQGVDGNPYDGANTLGLWQQDADRGQQKRKHKFQNAFCHRFYGSFLIYCIGSIIPACGR